MINWKGIQTAYRKHQTIVWALYPVHWTLWAGSCEQCEQSVRRQVSGILDVLPTKRLLLNNKQTLNMNKRRKKKNRSSNKLANVQRSHGFWLEKVKNNNGKQWNFKESTLIYNCTNTSPNPKLPLFNTININRSNNRKRKEIKCDEKRKTMALWKRVWKRKKNQNENEKGKEIESTACAMSMGLSWNNNNNNFIIFLLL